MPTLPLVYTEPMCSDPMTQLINSCLASIVCTREEAAILRKFNVLHNLNPYSLQEEISIRGTFQIPLEVTKRNDMSWVPSGVLDSEAAKKLLEVRFKNCRFMSNVDVAHEELVYSRDSQKAIIRRLLDRQLHEIKTLHRKEMKKEMERSKQCLAPLSILPTHVKENDAMVLLTMQDIRQRFNKMEAERYDIEMGFGDTLLAYSGATNMATTNYKNYETAGTVTNAQYGYFEETLQQYYPQIQINHMMPEGTIIIDEQRFAEYPLHTTYSTTTDTNSYEDYASRMRYYEMMGIPSPFMASPYNPQLFENISSEAYELREKQQKERQFKLQSADEKAQKLLKDMISEIDFRRYKEKGYLLVKGESGRIYRIWNNNTMLDVYELEAHQKDYSQNDKDSQMRIIKPNELAIHLLKDDKLTLRRKLCIHSPSKNLPQTDEVILKFILAKNDEKRLLEMSHHFIQSEQPTAPSEPFGFGPSPIDPSRIMDPRLFTPQPHERLGLMR